MATIKFDSIVIDRFLDGIFESSDGEIIGGVNQLENVSIETSAETKDKTDANGVLIKRFYTSKSVTLSAENAVFSTSLAALEFGSDREVASEDNVLTFPRIIKVTVANTDGTYTLPDTPVDGSVVVAALDDTGVADATIQYTLGDEAGEGVYSIADTVVTLPTDVADRVLIKYEREVSADAVKITQYADKFPSNCKATFSVLVCDACDNEVLRQAYIVFPSFQMDPNHTLSFSTEDTQSFSGIAMKDYCDAEGELFSIYMSADDEYED